MQNEIQHGLKGKTIKKLIRKRFDEFTASIEDQSLRDMVKTNTIITGGCIASMLVGDQVNDYDLYFRNMDTAEAAAKYYVGKFPCSVEGDLSVSTENGRVRIVTADGHRGQTAGQEALGSPGDIEDTYDQTEAAALETESEKEKPFRPVFLSTNAITLSGRVQLVLRFFGEPDEIHSNYDFVHCTNHWDSKTDELTLRPAALESLLSRELRYTGSKYPVCSIMRLRKFIKRGWTINAGQILKMVMQVSELDLMDPKVLEDQLTGVDSAYFCQLMEKLKEKDPEKVNAAYLVEIINRMF